MFDVAGGATSTLIVTTQGDGKDAIKMGGNPMTTQKSELSADGKVIKVDSSATVPGQQNGTEYWDKK